MRWVVLSDDYSPMVGGVAVTTSGLVAGLRRLGHHVSVYARQRPLLPSDVVGVKGRHFGRYGGKYLCRAAAGELAHADRVLCSTWQLARPLPTQLLDRLVLVGHGSDLWCAQTDELRRIWRGARKRFALSPFLQQRLDALGVPSEVLPPPVPPPVGGPRGHRRAAWGVVARAVPGKGIERAITLGQALGRQVEVIGSGPLLPSLRRRFEGVRFLGQLPHTLCLERMYRWEAMMLLPDGPTASGQAEGLGLCLVEGALRGVLPIGSAVGGVPHAVGQGGVIIDPSDVQGARERIEGALPFTARAPFELTRTVELLCA